MASTRGQVERSRRAAAVTLSVAAHAVALFVAVRAAPDPPVVIETAPMVVQLVTPPPPDPPPPPVEAAPTPEPAAAAPPLKPEPKPKPPPRRIVARPTPAPPVSVPPVPAARDAGEGEDDGAGEVSDAELAGAATAGSGGSGGGCDMPAMVQRALRKDGQVRSVVAEVHRGKALRVWNGGWVRHRGQEGAGLAAVREAIMWEVAWAPEECRAQRMSGPVVLSMADGPGAARIVVGGGQWRWSDLLFARAPRATRR